MTKETVIGVIGQGYVGKNYADDFQDRGFTVVRYALEEPYVGNKNKIASCDVVFIGVPTPTTPEGFDHSIVEDALTLVGDGKIAVIKSTLLPGTTEALQKRHPEKTVLFSPEFLSEATARADVSTPFVSIAGMSKEGQEAEAALVLSLLPEAPLKQTMTSTQAEIFKYAHNSSGYIQIVFFNMLYDLAGSLGQDWDAIRTAIAADPYICNRYSDPIHKSGRGAGGHCFIKDFAALKGLYEQVRPEDSASASVFEAVERKNLELLAATRKDEDLVRGVYGSATT
jgi:UDPglucose 6-dehydrogenase